MFKLQVARAEIRDLKQRLALADKSAKIDKMTPQEFSTYCDSEVSSAVYVEQTIKKLKFRGWILF